MKPFLLIAALLLAIPSIAQDEISCDIGYGLTGREFKNFEIFDSDNQTIVLAGVNYSRKWPDSVFATTAGLNLISRTEDRGNTDRVFFLNVPVGLEYITGRKMMFLVGGGLYLNTVIAGDAISEGYKRFAFGAFGKIGTGFQINDKYKIIFSVRVNHDITRTRENISTHMAGRYSTSWEEWFTDKFLGVSLVRKL